MRAGIVLVLIAVVGLVAFAVIVTCGNMEPSSEKLSTTAKLAESPPVTKPSESSPIMKLNGVYEGFSLEVRQEGDEYKVDVMIATNNTNPHDFITALSKALEMVEEKSGKMDISMRNGGSISTAVICLKDRKFKSSKD